MESPPKSMIAAIDALIRRGQETKDFSDEELSKLRTARALCCQDVKLLNDAHLVLATQRHHLARKEECLSAFMAQLSPDELEAPIIDKLLKSFMATHIQHHNKLRQIETLLETMYPGWTRRPIMDPAVETDPDLKMEASHASHSDLGAIPSPPVMAPSVDKCLDDALDALEGSESPAPEDGLDATQSSLDLGSDPGV